MSKAPEQSQFDAYLQAFFEKRPAMHQFGVLANVVVLPDHPVGATVLLHTLHEWAHSQLSDTPLGLTLQLMGKLAANVQRSIVPHLSDSLAELRSKGELAPDLHRDLFAFGRCDDPARIPAAFEPYWRQLSEQAPLARAVRGFDVLTRRWFRLLAKWHMTQEVFAIACSHSVATGLMPDDSEIVEELCDLLGITRSSIRSELSNVADQQLHELMERGDIYGTAAEFYSVTAQASRPFATLVLALAASAFPYHACDLIDMPDHEFERWIEGGALDIEKRLRRLEPYAEFASGFEDDPSVAAELLEVASDGLHAPSALCGESHLFGAWTRRFLWGSTLFQDAVDDRVERFLNGDVLEQHKEHFDIDRRSDIRMSVNTPNYLFERDRRIICPPGVRPSFEMNFADTFAVYRTVDLLRILRERFDG
ncbi:MAG: hypothetical protein AAFQ31_05570 [Planctomycetota bacterium]